jgi:FkbM family methyltransferase
MKKKIVFVAPHLSTGGMPQYLVKQVESIKDDMDVYCIEWDNVTGGVLVIQRNKMVNLLGDRLITLGENKHELFNIIQKIQPDIIHLQEIPELFMDQDVADKLYTKNRSYVIIETSHDSGYDPKNSKVYLPDKFLMVSQYQANLYKDIDIPCDIVEYPIENKTRTKSREQALRDLGLDPNLKHVINVGLFTPRKNQAEIIEYARLLKHYPIQFHFIGNHADNFKFYWEPLMREFPSNCKWWNERSDVDSFYEAADLFLFTSRGSTTDHETMPLVIREALSWKTPSLIYNLPVYMGYFDKYDTIEYLTEDTQRNAYRIAEKLLHTTPQTVQLAEFADSYFDFEFNGEENKITMNYKRQGEFYTKVSVKDKDSNAPIYWFDVTFNTGINYWVMPLPIQSFKFSEEPSFSTLLLEFYDAQNNLQFSKDIYVKEATQKRTVKLDLKNPFDCLFNNYNEMFVERKYDCYNLNNLDVVLDIGANNGLFSLLMLNDGCKKIYAFEPNQESLINLKHLFRNTDKVVSVEKAVYTKDEPLEFFIDPNNTTIGSVSEQHLLSNGTSVQKIVVPAVSLKTFIKENNLDRISLVKMDIEGAEYEIIHNLEDEIFDKVDRFLIEYHENTDNRVVKLIDKLKSKGYDIDQIRNQNSKNNDLMTYTYQDSKIGTFLAKKAPAEKLLTVIVPSHNHEKYIEQCVDSILQQKTLFNFNILISDDCSTDSTYNIIQKYKDIPNIQIQKTEQNEGPTPRRIHNLIKNIKSDYITFLDGDDYYLDEYKLQKQIDFLEANPEYSVHSTGWLVTAEDSVAYGYDGTRAIDMHSLKREVTLQENCIDTNYVGFGFMIKNKHIVNRHFPEWVFGEDVFCGYWALNNIMLEYGKAKNEQWVGGRYRITPSGHFGEKNEEWKAQQTKRQLAVLQRVYNPSVKPIVIVDAFFHDAHCLTTFKSYLEFIKKLDVPIMLVTNSNFDTSLVDEVDYILYDSNNRLFKHPYTDIGNIIFYWSGEHHYISLGTPALQRHGLSVLSNIYHSTNLAKSLGYTHFYRIEYDCFIDKIENVKAVIDTVEQHNKKGMVYLNENRYISFQLWYFELEYFTKYFPKINNEDEYRAAKEVFNSERDFISAEEFIYNMIKISEGGFSNLIVKTGTELHSDYGNCSWNTLTSPSESDKIVDGCVSTISKVTIESDEIRALRSTPRPEWEYSPESCEIDMSKVAFVTWNSSSSMPNRAVAKFTYPDGTVRTIEHVINGINDNRVDLIDVVDGDINVEISLNGRTSTHHIVNKNTIPKFVDVYQKRSPS